jgi:predicted nucleic acid-binding protein
MAERLFVDTWGWLALGHRRDPHHQVVKEYYQEQREKGTRIYTSDYVLDEVLTLLFRREVFAEAVRFMEGLFASAQQGHLVLVRITAERFSSAWALRRRYQDKPTISFTDLTSMAIIEELEVAEVLTGDTHFVEVGMAVQRVP